MCSCCLPGGQLIEDPVLAGGSHSSWREFDVHGKVDWAELPILKVVGEVVFCGIAVAEQLRGAVANQHE